MDIEDVIAYGIVILLTILATNCIADQKTLQDCAVKGTAKMFAGGVIKCDIVKELP